MESNKPQFNEEIKVVMDSYKGIIIKDMTLLAETE